MTYWATQKISLENNPNEYNDPQMWSCCSNQNFVCLYTVDHSTILSSKRIVIVQVNDTTDVTKDNFAEELETVQDISNYEKRTDILLYFIPHKWYLSPYDMVITSIHFDWFIQVTNIFFNTG